MHTEGVRVDVSKFVTEGKGELHRRYQETELLGKGAFGEVRLVLDSVTKEYRAMKVIPKENCTEVASASLIEEVAVLKKLDHPNIIKLFEFYQDEDNYYLITEHCTGGELFDRITESGHFTEQKAAGIMRQLLSAVAYCHARKIVHRYHHVFLVTPHSDLKPENILFESTAKNAGVKVIDFGTAMAFRPDHKMSQCIGTVLFLAHKISRRTTWPRRCCTNTMMRSATCGAAALSCTSCCAEDRRSEGSRTRRSTRESTRASTRLIVSSLCAKTIGAEWNAVSAEAKSLISRMLAYKSENRVTAQQALEDPWIKRWMAGKSGELSKSAGIALRSLRNFKVQVKLQQAAMAYMASHMQSKETETRLRAAFQAFDKNGDGLLDRSELIEGYLKLGMKRTQAAKVVENIMATIDLNKNGTIDYSEFLMANMNKEEVLSQEKLKEAFRLFDKVLRKTRTHTIGRERTDNDERDQRGTGRGRRRVTEPDRGRGRQKRGRPDLLLRVQAHDA